jgi:hypothetical protein
MFPPIHPALSAHFTWCDRMKKLVANPVMDTLSKQWRDERERMARAVASLNLKEIR